MAPFSQFIGDRQYWGEKRWEYLDAARECRAALTRSDGLYGYDASDERVKAAMRFWIHRARDAHAFALGRKPVVSGAVVIASGRASIGDLYAREGA